MIVTGAAEMFVTSTSCDTLGMSNVRLEALKLSVAGGAPPMADNATDKVLEDALVLIRSVSV